MGRSASFRFDAEAGAIEISWLPYEGHSATGYCESSAVYKKHAHDKFMLHETCYFSSDYESELRTLENPANVINMTKVVQFPYTVPVRSLCQVL